MTDDIRPALVTGSLAGSYSLTDIWRAATYHKLIVGSVTALAICGGLAYIVNAQPLYRSTAMFRIEGSGGGSSLGGSAGGIVLSGLGGSKNGAVFDRVMGFNFIFKVADELDLQNDPYFTTPRLAPGAVIAMILPERLAQMVSGGAPKGDQTLIMQHLIADRYQRSVTASETDNGSIAIDVRHPDREKASLIANTIMHDVVQDLEREQRANFDRRSSYMNEQLSASNEELRAAEYKLSNFALQNDLKSGEVLASRSALLDRLRNEVARTEQTLAALTALQKARGAGSIRAVRDANPIIDNPRFLRLVDQYSPISAGSIPTNDRLNRAISVTRQEKTNAESQLQAMEAETSQYTQSAQDLAGLERDVQRATVAFQGLAEQSRAYALSAGLDSLSVNIFSDALTPVRKSTPKGAQLMVASTFLGGLLGMLGSLLLSIRQNRVFTLQMLDKIAGPRQILRLPFWSRNRAVEHVARTIKRDIEMSAAGVIVLGNESGRSFPQWRDQLIALLRRDATTRVTVFQSAETGLTTLDGASIKSEVVLSPKAFYDIQTLRKIEELREEPGVTIIVTEGETFASALALLEDTADMFVVGAARAVSKSDNITALAQVRDRLTVIWES